MKYCIWIVAFIIITACLGQLNRLPIAGQEGVVLYLNDILMGLVAACYVLYALAVRKAWFIPKPFVYFLGFAALAPIGLFISTISLSTNEIIISVSYLIRFVCYAAIALIVFDSIYYAKSASVAQAKVTYWIKVLFAASLLMVLSGLIQLIILPDFADLAKYGWDPHIGRLATAMLDPNYAGAYLSIAAICAASLLLYAKQTSKRILYATLLLIFIGAIFLTYSRSAYVMLGVGLGVVALFKARWLILVAAIIGVVAFVTIPRFNERVVGALTVDVTASIRISSWQNSLMIASHNQPFGIGFNSYRYAQDYYGIVNMEDSGNAGAGADSSWLFILATTGVVGLALYLAFYSTITVQATSKLFASNTPTSHKAIYLAFVAIMISLIPASMINNSLFYTWILQLWWLLVGLVLALMYSKPKHSDLE